MFTGIVQAVGRVAAVDAAAGGLRVTIDCAGLDLGDVAVGDSIAVSGCCLTAVDLSATGFAADVSHETVSVTTLGRWAEGTRVNLEKPLRLADRLGGHLVSGHVDGVARVLEVTPDGDSQRWTLEAPRALRRYIAAKGSVTLDGTSLTVNQVDGARFGVNLIPHTLAHTSFGARAPGDEINIEVDLVARHVERLLQTED